MPEIETWTDRGCGRFSFFFPRFGLQRRKSRFSPNCDDSAIPSQLGVLVNAAPQRKIQKKKRHGFLVVNLGGSSGLKPLCCRAPDDRLVDSMSVGLASCLLVGCLSS